MHHKLNMKFLFFLFFASTETHSYLIDFNLGFNNEILSCLFSVDNYHSLPIGSWINI